MDGPGGPGGNGGAILINAGEVHLTHVTLVDNAGGTGAWDFSGATMAPNGLSGIVAQTGASAVVNNSILWSNCGIPFEHGTEEDQISGDSTVFSSCITGRADLTGGNIADDPMLTSAWILQEGSPAVNAADLLLLPADQQDLDADGDTEEPLPVDRAGNSRLVGSAPDMGAHERQ
jgi:hypothetical protein